jgi:hypothetical protein
MLAQVDAPHVLTDDEILDAVAEVYRAEARLAARKAALIAEMDARRSYAVVGAQTAAAWITHRCRVPRGKAHHDVVLARSLRRLPATAAALGSGDITEAHVTALVRHHTNNRTGEALERDEHVLVAEAERLPFRLFSTVLAYWAQRVDPDGTDDDAEARRARRRLHLSRTFDGMWALDGLLDPVSGAAVDTALRQVMSEPDDGVTPAQRRADALVELAHRATSTPAGSRRPAPLVSVLVGYETFAGRVCELADGTVIAPRDVAALLDEAVIERAVFDGPGRVIEIGEQRRFVGALRRAIEVRDRTCTHDWCDTPAARCDVDHVLPWAWRGPTTQDNGRLLCPFHNHLRQRRGPPSLN